jgi:hypothetical protein
MLFHALGSFAVVEQTERRLAVAPSRLKTVENLRRTILREGLR